MGSSFSNQENPTIGQQGIKLQSFIKVEEIQGIINPLNSLKKLKQETMKNQFRQSQDAFRQSQDAFRQSQDAFRQSQDADESKQKHENYDNTGNKFRRSYSKKITDIEITDMENEQGFLKNPHDMVRRVKKIKPANKNYQKRR